MTTLHGRTARDFASSLAFTYINGDVLDLVLTDVPDLVGVRVGLPVSMSVHSVVFIDVVLEQLIPHLVTQGTGIWLEEM